MTGTDQGGHGEGKAGGHLHRQLNHRLAVAHRRRSWWRRLRRVLRLLFKKGPRPGY